MKITFSVEPSAGEETNSIHLWFGRECRIEVASSIDEFDGFIHKLERIRDEIQESHPHDFEC